MTENKSINIKFISQDGYKRQRIKESTTRPYVMNGDKPTAYYDYVLARYKGSPTNAVIINSFVNMAYGQGLAPKSPNFKVEDWIKVKEVLNSKDVRANILDHKLFGESSLQVIEKNGRTLSSISHIAKNKVLPSVADDEDNINSYWFSRDWNKLWTNKNKPKEIEAFNFSKKQKQSLYNIKPYSAGNEYFRDPEYAAGLPYAEMEEEIATFYINHIRSGLSFGYIISIPDGSFTNEEINEIESKIKNKLTGSSNAGKFVLDFYEGDKKIEVTPLEVNDAHNQWEYLTTESRQQILTAHGVTSPMLFGVKDNTGLGNNANELEEARKMYIKDVIKPFRQPIIEAYEDILLKYGISIKLKFSDLEDEEEEIVKSEEKKEQENVELSEKKNVVNDLGEVIDLTEWDLVDQIDVDYEEEEELFNKIELTSTGTARPNSKSSQDGENYIVRYKYTGRLTDETRGFCRKMMTANKVYRKEDILMMSNMVVNEGWGPNGVDKYDIWLYKGGGNCHHKWNRVIYLKKGSNLDVNSPLAEIISTSEARRRKFNLETNNTLVSVEPRNMTNNGFLKPR